MTRLTNVIIPPRGTSTWDIEITKEGTVSSVTAHQPPSPDAPSLLIPPLCHPHIHLDKAYLLTSHGHLGHDSPHPSYADLATETGTFEEALKNTSAAKERYTVADLHRRGAQLLATARVQGVTAVRAFVEVDHVTGTLALEAGITLKREFRDHGVEVQICAFAQDPLFSTEHGGRNREVMEEVLEKFKGEIEALGTTPYVEQAGEEEIEGEKLTQRALQVRNIEWAVETALSRGLHLDFHLDYNLTPVDLFAKPVAFAVLDALVEADWNARAGPNRTIVLGHCTRLTKLTSSQLEGFALQVMKFKLPIHFVGLPTSDLYMMGRSSGDAGLPMEKRRGTLQVPTLIRKYGLNACLGVNNVGNAFTPFGTGDPLTLASWGVGLYHAGTSKDAAMLYGCVSWRARAAIGLAKEGDGAEDEEVGNVKEGDQWSPMMLVENREFIGHLPYPARRRLGYQDVVWDPPETLLRKII